MLRAGTIIGLLLWIGLAAPSCTQRPPAPTNLILVSIDTLRADHTSVYGYDRETTPNLARLAQDAVVFENAFTVGGATLPSHISMLTGLPYHAHRVTMETKKPLDDGIPLVAEVLADRGYSTGAFLGGAWVQARFGFDRGFGAFETGDVTFAKTLPRARAWLDSIAAPFFLFLHTLDVHSAQDRAQYDSPPKFRDTFVDPRYPKTFDGCRDDRCASEILVWLNKAAQRREVDLDTYFSPAELDYIMAQYDGGIVYADHELGRFFDHLRERGLYDDSLIIVTADHGEEFLEHGLFLHHQNNVEVSHVPLLVKLPGSAHAGKRVDAIVSIMDIAPTLLSAAGVPVPDHVQGQDLISLAEGHAEPREALLVAGGAEYVRTPRWSLVTRKGAVRLHDLTKDPGELHSVADEHPEVVQRLSALYEDLRARDDDLGDRLHRAKDADAVDLDESTVQHLRALGYVE